MLKSVLIDGKGRGILADRDYKVGEIICEEDVLINNVSTTRILRKTYLKYYLFDWPNNKIPSKWNQSAICLGFGSLFNHSHINPNIVWSIINSNQPKIRFKAKENIVAGTELVHNYRWNPTMSKGLIC